MGKRKGKPRPRDLAKTTPHLLSEAQADQKASLYPEDAKGAMGCILGEIHHETLLQGLLGAPAQARRSSLVLEIKATSSREASSFDSSCLSHPGQERGAAGVPTSSDPLLTTVAG